MKKIAQILFIAGFLCQTQSAFAAGFILAEQSVTSLGTANAANTAGAIDATTAYSNPAGMVFLDYENELVSGIFAIVPHNKYKDKGTINVLQQPFPDSANAGDGGSTGYVPDLSYVKRIGCNFALGLAVNGPFGLVTDYNDRWYGRYYATRSAIEAININPSFAYKIGNCLSIGGGFNAMYFHTELKNMVDFGLIAFSATSGAVGVPEQQDGEAKVKGNTWGYGGNIGIMYQYCNTRIGVQWRSQTRIDINKGSVKYKIPDALQPLLGANFFDTKAKARLTLPDTVSVGLYHKFCNKIAVMADFQWTHWELLQQLKIRFPDGAAALRDTTVPLKWKNTWRYAVGLAYDFNCSWTIRGGYAYDESPAPGKVFMTPRLPDGNRNWLTLGLGYSLNECMGVDLCYAHVFIDDVAVDKRAALATVEEFQTAGGLYGKFKGYANIVGASVKYRF